MLIAITGCSTSGISLTRSFCSARMPSAISMRMMTTVASGRRMLKSERTMASAHDGGGRGAGGGAGVFLHRLVVLKRGNGMAQHAVAVGEAGPHDEVAAARVALAELQRRLLQLA